MSVLTVRRLASDLLGVGQNKIRINPAEIKRAGEALTRSDVLALIKDGVVYKLPKQGRRQKEKKKRRHRGSKHGRGTINQKKEWMKKIRAQRKYLRELLAGNQVNRKFRRELYGKIKSGLFKSKNTMYTYLKEGSMLAEAKPEGKKSVS